MRKNLALPVVLAGFLLTLISCSSSGGLEVSDAWARPAAEGMNTAVYFTVNNPASGSDTLLGARSDVARTVEMHLSTAVTPAAGGEPMEEGGAEGMTGEVMGMVRQESIEIPSRGSVVFEPGGLHIMLFDLVEELEEGESITVTLQFQEGGDISIQVPVEMR